MRNESGDGTVALDLVPLLILSGGGLDLDRDKHRLVMQKTDRGAVDLHDTRGVADGRKGLLRDPNSRLVRVAQVEPVEDDAALVSTVQHGELQFQVPAEAVLGGLHLGTRNGHVVIGSGDGLESLLRCDLRCVKSPTHVLCSCGCGGSVENVNSRLCVNCRRYCVPPVVWGNR